MEVQPSPNTGNTERTQCKYNHGTKLLVYD